MIDESIRYVVESLGELKSPLKTYSESTKLYILSAQLHESIHVKRGQTLQTLWFLIFQCLRFTTKKSSLRTQEMRENAHNESPPFPHDTSSKRTPSKNFQKCHICYFSTNIFWPCLNVIAMQQRRRRRRREEKRLFGIINQRSFAFQTREAKKKKMPFPLPSSSYLPHMRRRKNLF